MGYDIGHIWDGLWRAGDLGINPGLAASRSGGVATRRFFVRVFEARRRMGNSSSIFYQVVRIVELTIIAFIINKCIGF